MALKLALIHRPALKFNALFFNGDALDIGLFANATGRLVALTARDPTDPTVTHGFIPDDLPPTWPWPARLWPLLKDATAALARLDGMGEHLPSPDLVLRPLQTREAMQSSRLEGTVTDPQQQALFELEPKVSTSDTDPVNGYREINNYSRALRIKLENRIALPLSLSLIKQLHAVLMDGVRGSDRHPGEFRRVQNKINTPSRYVPPPPVHLPGTLENLELYLVGSRGFDPLVDAFLVHYQFEAIHPFEDGNGRVGRLLLAITIAEWCGLSNQWLYMSAYFEKHQATYQDLLLRVSTNGEWEAWIEFCLNGVVQQANDTLLRCRELLALNRKFYAAISSKGSVRLAQLIDDLFISPVAIVTTVRRKLGVSYPTALADLKKLEEAKILAPLTGHKQKAYYCQEIFDVVLRS